MSRIEVYTTASTTDVFAEAKELSRALEPLLADHHPAAVGAALCAMTARLLAGHFDGAGAEATAKLREEVLAMHIDAIRVQIPALEAEILSRTRRSAS